MRLFVDENMGAAFVATLRAAGLDVSWAVPDQIGWSDSAIADYASDHMLTVVTEDRGFPELLLAQRKKPFGVILLRLFRLAEPDRMHLAVRSILKLPSPMVGKIAVIEPGGSRLIIVSTKN